jgi:hypothetical protein
MTLCALATILFTLAVAGVSAAFLMLCHLERMADIARRETDVCSLPPRSNHSNLNRFCRAVYRADNGVLTMMNLSIHFVAKVELCFAYPGNGNSRTIRITDRNGEQEITLYGNTDALDALPRSEDFRSVGECPA